MKKRITKSSRSSSSSCNSRRRRRRRARRVPPLLHPRQRWTRGRIFLVIVKFWVQQEDWKKLLRDTEREKSEKRRRKRKVLWFWLRPRNSDWLPVGVPTRPADTESVCVYSAGGRGEGRADEEEERQRRQKRKEKKGKAEPVKRGKGLKMQQKLMKEN